MAKKLSPATGATGAIVRVLALVALLVVAFANAVSTASAARPYGVWKVTPGKTLQLTNMSINGCDTDTAYIFVDDVVYDTLGTNSGNECNSVFPGDYTYTSDGSLHTVTLEIYDGTQGCGFFSDGPNAAASRTEFAINDGGGICGIFPATLGGGNFHGNVSVSHSP